MLRQIPKKKRKKPRRGKRRDYCNDFVCVCLSPHLLFAELYAALLLPNLTCFARMGRARWEKESLVQLRSTFCYAEVKKKELHIPCIASTRCYLFPKR